MTTASNIAQTLDLERQRQGLTVTGLIERAGVSRAALYRLFAGGDVQLTTLLAITDALGLDLVAMRGNLSSLMPEVGAGAIAAAPAPSALQGGRPMQHTQRRTTSPVGPQSAVAARAARLAQKLQGKP